LDGFDGVSHAQKRASATQLKQLREVVVTDIIKQNFYIQVIKAKMGTVK
jgi:hypothetical protein